jgi:hypothetical protein
MFQAVNENWAPSSRSRPGSEGRGSGGSEGGQLSTQDCTALAILRSGRSFAEAAESAGIPLARVVDVWRQTRPH